MWRVASGQGVQMEGCVLCRAPADYPKGTPISDRDNYIEGIGQLCATCYEDLYLKGRSKDG